MVCRLLVADDSSTIQKVIRIGLAAIQTDIKSAGSLLEANKIVDQGSLDLIIADAGLPGISTAGDFIKLVERAGGVPLIILMGSYEAVKESDLREVGITHIIKKPFPPGELPKLVESLTSNRRAVAAPAPPEPPAQALPSPNLPRAGVGDIPSFLLADEALAMPDHRSTKQSETLASMPSFALSEDEFPGVMPPTPEVEPARKGRPAFDSKSGLDSPLAKAFPAAPKSSFPEERTDQLSPGAKQAAASSHQQPMTQAGLSAAVEAFVRDELPTLVDRAVERYCAEHFKGVAREVLTAELRRLAEEKARYLVDQ
jgi:DNA-binding response OmpR family regulator